MSFSFPQAVIASLVLHGVVVLPFVMPVWNEPPEEPSILVVELKGLDAPIQTEEKVSQQTKGAAEHQATQAPSPESPPPKEIVEQKSPQPEPPPEPVADDGVLQQATPEQPDQVKQEEASPQAAPPSTEVPAVAGSAGAVDVEGEDHQQKAQAISKQQDEAEELRTYVKALNKKVVKNLIYPDAGRRRGLQGKAGVGFTLHADGSIAPASLRIIKTSGQPQLDASALKSVEASAPFEPPPRPISIAITVVYGEVASGGKP